MNPAFINKFGIAFAMTACKHINVFTLLLLLLPGQPWAAVNSTQGNILFDSNADGSHEAHLNSTGLGIGADPSANLHVSGNAIATKSISVGGAGNPSGSNLHLHGTFAMSIASVGAGANQISNASIVLADTSSGDVSLQLPDLADSIGQMITVKKISSQNKLMISGSGNTLDNFHTLSYSSGNLVSIEIFNNGSNWFIMNQSSGKSLQEVGADNLLLWWKLEETSGNSAGDSSSTGNYSANLINEHYFSGNTASGPLGSALTLRDYGANAVYESGNLPADGYSYSLWVKYNHASGNTVVYPPEIAGKAGFVWASDNAFYHMSAFHKLDVGGNYATTPITSTSSLAADTWHHLAVSWDGATLRLYLNGAFESGNTAATWVSGTNISIENPGLFSTSEMSVDDVRFFNKAMSESEVQVLYGAGNP